MICKICNINYKSFKSLSFHLIKHNITSKKYYDNCLKKEKEEICLNPNCSNITNFININKGYRKYCSYKCSILCTREERKNTCIKKYGVDNPLKNKDMQKKRRETLIKKYGVDNPLKNKSIKEKQKQTCIKKYGVDNPLKNKDMQKKRRETLIKKYGVDNPFKNKDVQNKIKHIFIEKYETNTPLKNKDVQEKIKQTCIKKYGVDNPFKNKDVQNKIKHIFIEKYGVDNPFKNKDMQNKIKQERLNKRLPVVFEYLKNLNLKIVDKKYKNAKNSINIKCLICDTVFKTYYDYIYKGYGKCPNCYPKYKSIAETEIINFIKNLGFGIISNTRKLIPPYELDIYIPDKKIAIEHNGLFWHSEICGKDREYHLNKLNLCEKKDIQLIQIFEDEWLFKQDIVKEYLKKLLNVLNNSKIYARQCKIKEIPTKIKNKFLDTYHLQGKDNSSIKLGAYYSEELVSIMTFSHGSLSRGVKYKNKLVWELNRYCSNYNYHIPGIASKLLKYFQRNYGWEEIYSYADRRWSTGNLYKVLGFTFKHATKPSYWYTKGLKRIHRFNLRKKLNEPKDIPEWLLRSKDGYIKVWDCGHLKFTLNKGDIDECYKMRIVE